MNNRNQIIGCIYNRRIKHPRLPNILKVELLLERVISILLYDRNVSVFLSSFDAVKGRSGEVENLRILYRIEPRRFDSTLPTLVGEQKMDGAPFTSLTFLTHSSRILDARDGSRKWVGVRGSGRLACTSVTRWRESRAILHG